MGSFKYIAIVNEISRERQLHHSARNAFCSKPAISCHIGLTASLLSFKCHAPHGLFGRGVLRCSTEMDFSIVARRATASEKWKNCFNASSTRLSWNRHTGSQSV